MPSYVQHLSFVERLMYSLDKFCIDCTHIPVLVVVSSNDEVDVFETSLKSSASVPKLQIVALGRLFEDSGEKVDAEKLRHVGTMRGPPGKHLFQSAKKLYGCLRIVKDCGSCFTFDSESFFVTRTSVVTMVSTYLERPTIVTNSIYTPGWGHCFKGSSETAYNKCVEKSVGPKHYVGEQGYLFIIFL